MALEIAGQQKSLYLDLEDENDRVKLSDPSKYLEDHQDELIVLDEVHRVPEIFQQLRGIIDRGRRRGKANGRFLLLASAAIDLLKQSGESLAGRISISNSARSTLLKPAPRQWTRDGSEAVFRATSWQEPTISARSGGVILCELTWSAIFLNLDHASPAETLRRFWTMLAHNQGQILNAANLVRGLAVDGKTIAGYLDLLLNLLVVRRLPACHRNIGKRLVKSPKVYVRDAGIAHALLGVRDKEASKHSSPRPRTGPKRTITEPPTGQRSTFSLLRCLMANFGLLR